MNYAKTWWWENRKKNALQQTNKCLNRKVNMNATDTLSCPDHGCFWPLILYSLGSVRYCLLID